MKLTTKGRYAVMAMADLASYQNGKPVSLNDISLRQNISLSFGDRLRALTIACSLAPEPITNIFTIGLVAVAIVYAH